MKKIIINIIKIALTYKNTFLNNSNNKSYDKTN